MKLLNFLKTHKLLGLALLALFFTGCKKKDGPTYTDMKVTIQKDGIRYIEETPSNPFNQVFAPKMRYGGSWKVGEEDKRNIHLSAALYKEGDRGNVAFRIGCYIPLYDGIKLNTKYEFKPIGDQEEYIPNGNVEFPSLGEAPYLSYQANDNKTFFATGHLIITKLTQERGATIAEGKMEFSVPNSNGTRSTLIGTFKLVVDGYPQQ